jgi:predicted transcriptional regulator
MLMASMKDAAIETIKKMPDECTVEDIMYEIDFIAQVMDGLRDADEGRTISTEELLARVKKWGR